MPGADGQLTFAGKSHTFVAALKNKSLSHGL